MIDQKTVYAILSDSSLNQTRAQVEALLEKELQKPENEMDAALVEEYVLTLAEMDGADYKPLVPAQPPAASGRSEEKEKESVPLAALQPCGPLACVRLCCWWLRPPGSMFSPASRLSPCIETAR